MHQSMIHNIVRTARRSLLAAFAMAALLLIILPLEHGFTDNRISAANEKVRAAAVIAEQIKLEDERLTMSAWMAATTGDQRWVDRYNRYLPAIDREIAEAKALAPDALSKRFDAETSKANEALVALESAAFEAIKAGDLARARAILDSGEYRTQKKILSDGTSKFSHGLSAYAAAELASVKGRMHVLLFVMSSLVGLGFLVMWHLLNKHLSRLEVAFVYFANN